MLTILAVLISSLTTGLIVHLVTRRRVRNRWLKILKDYMYDPCPWMPVEAYNDPRCRFAPEVGVVYGLRVVGGEVIEDAVQHRRSDA